MRNVKGLQLLPYRTFADSEVQLDWLEPSELAIPEWGDTSCVTLKAKVTVSTPGHCGLEVFRVGIAWRCDASNQGGANWVRAESEDLANGVEVDLTIKGSAAEGDVELQTLLLADEGSPERLCPNWAASVLWSRTERLKLGGGWGFPVACGEYNSPKEAGVPWFLVDAGRDCYRATVLSGPLLVINLAHPDGRALHESASTRNDLVLRAAADVLRGLVLGLILNTEDEQTADSEFGQNSLGKDLSRWLCSMSGKLSVSAFADHLRNSPGDLDRLIASYLNPGRTA